MTEVGGAFLASALVRAASPAEVAEFVEAYIGEWNSGVRYPAGVASALGALGVDAGSAVFVGDTFAPDFAGPERAGITSFLVDPRRAAPVPDARRLASVLDLPARLASG